MRGRTARFLLALLLLVPSIAPARNLPPWWRLPSSSRSVDEAGSAEEAREPQLETRREIRRAEAPEGVLRLVSWNLLNLTTNSPTEKFAEVLANYDLVALQEVKEREALEMLRKELQRRTGVTWHRSVSREVGDGQRAELMAFLYRTDRVRSVRRGPRGVYRPKRPEYFVRAPYYATFRAGEFDFTVINYHARWGRSDRITEEVARLGQVYRHVQDASDSEDDVILVGDFNRDAPDHRAFDLLRESGMTHVVEGEGEFTTYSTSEDRIGANFYDNIWIDEEHTLPDFTGRSGVFYIHEHFYQDDEHPHLTVRVAISDHCPVWAEFYTDRDDD